jgi:hypothetical protein
MARAASVLACFLVGLGGCKHETPHERMNRLLPINDFRSEPADGSKRPKDDKDSHLTPERIHGGII